MLSASLKKTTPSFLPSFFLLHQLSALVGMKNRISDGTEWDRSDDLPDVPAMSYIPLLGVMRPGCICVNNLRFEVLRRKEVFFYLTMHSTHFIYGYMGSDIWLRTILRVRKETHCHHIGCSYRLTARVLLYAPCHRQDSTYHSVCYTSRGALAGMRNSSMSSPHEGSIRRPIAP